MAWLWLISVGVSDIQFPVWKKGEDGQFKQFRFHDGSGKTREKHVGLLALLSQGRIEFPEILPRDLAKHESKNLKLEFEQEEGSFIAAVKTVEPSGDNYRILERGNEICDEKLPLFCPKISVLIDVAKDIFANEPVTVLVIQTRRNESSREAQGEPIASGPLVANLVAERLGLLFKEGGALPERLEPQSASWFDIVVGEERTENPAVQASVIERLNKVMKACNINGNDNVLVTTAGGIAALKPLIERTPAIHLGAERIQLLESPEGGNTSPVPTSLDYFERLPEQETLRLFCAEALRKGDYAAAYGLAISSKQSWAITAKGFTGRLLGVPGSLHSFRFNDRETHTFELAALQIEIRLQMDDVCSALVIFGSFLENAAWNVLKNSDFVRKNDFKIERDERVIKGKLPSDIFNINKNKNQKDNHDRDRYEITSIYLDFLDYLNKKENSSKINTLVAIRNKYIKQSNPNILSLRECRNQYAHGAERSISPSQVRNSFLAAGFETGKPLGENFLSSQVVSEFLAAVNSAGLEQFIKTEINKALQKVILGDFTGGIT